MHILFKMLSVGIVLACTKAPDANAIGVRPLPLQGIDTGAVIGMIRAGFNEINAGVAHFRKQKRELSADFSSEGGSMERFYDSAKKLRKIVCESYGAIGRTHEEYYVRHDSLLFVFIKEYVYAEPINVNPNPRISKVLENRYYFFRNGIIQWLEGKQKKGPAEFSKRSGEILDIFKRYASIP